MKKRCVIFLLQVCNCNEDRNIIKWCIFCKGENSNINQILAKFYQLNRCNALNNGVPILFYQCYFQQSIAVAPYRRKCI